MTITYFSPNKMSARTNINKNPNSSLQGWGSGINGANANATTNATGFPPPKGQEYAQNSTTANNNAMSRDEPRDGANSSSSEQRQR
ncbi:hypothetical protein DFH08DRAFT_1081327 [Mycena albidolilacea]|uniref:Uncharacterized protein n=1 Tax=Mycena albidolilacea TaxID=1033008 RepID=A0AAD7EPL7_9AGAR|nr:hypothetical protein DFH08DRAFT_1081327 [Mycena albidolilacea]